MYIDLTTMKAIMENEKFALYLVEELARKKGTYKGVRLDKRNNSQTGVYIEKNKVENQYPPYRVIGFWDDRQR